MSPAALKAAQEAYKHRKKIVAIIVGIVIGVFILIMLPIMLIASLPLVVISCFSSPVETSEATANPNDVSIVSYIDIAKSYVDKAIEESHRNEIEYIDGRREELEGTEDVVICCNNFSSDDYDAVRIFCEYSSLLIDSYEEHEDEDILKAFREELEKHSYFTVNLVETEKIYRRPIKNVKASESTSETEESGTEESQEVRYEEIMYTEYEYTISYVGDDYITDVIFKLTDEQKEYAQIYRENLTAFQEEVQEETEEKTSNE